jgi:hypothetical protein
MPGRWDSANQANWTRGATDSDRPRSPITTNKLVLPHLAGELKDEAANAAAAIGGSMVPAQPGAVVEAMQSVIANVKIDELAGKAKNVLERARKAVGSGPQRP